MPDLPEPDLRGAFVRLRDRFLGEDEIAYRFQRAKELLRGNATEIEEGIKLAEETLTFDPYNVELNREVALAYARKPPTASTEDENEDPVYHHLAICFDMEGLDANAIRKDADLRLAMSAEAIEVVVRRIETEHRSRARFKDMCFDEIAPKASRWETTLAWAEEHQPKVLAAFERLVDAAVRTTLRVGFEKSEKSARAFLEIFSERVKSPFVMGDSLIGTFCYVGKVHQFLREISPYVEDVRFLMFDQVSPIDEFWIVGGVCHVRRHPLRDSDASTRATYFEVGELEEGRPDPLMHPYLASLWSDVAHVDLEANENKRSHADGKASGAEYAIKRLVELGRSPAFFQARLALFRNQSDAAFHLERAIEANPKNRDAVVMLAKCRAAEGNHEEAIRLANNAIALNPNYRDDIHLVKAKSLEALMRNEESTSAYERHAELRKESGGVLLSEADALFATGAHTSAAILYARLTTATYSTPIAAELGLARCAISAGDAATARSHRSKALEECTKRRVTYASSAGILAEINRLEALVNALVIE